jgi:type III secretion protein J
MQKWIAKCLLLIAMICFTGCEKHQAVITGVDEREANLIVVFLDSKGIKAQKMQMATSGMGAENAIPKFSIQVEPKDMVSSMAYLNQSGLPRKQGVTLLELFAKSGLMSSDKEETIRYQAGLEQQIINTIMMIDGVIDATVQISFPPQDITAQAQQKITASCYVKHQGVIDDPNAHLETKIKRLISGAVNGLDINDVTVVSDRSRYTDISPVEFKPYASDSKEYTYIWSMALSKESTSKFRVLFFSLTLFILLFATATAWLLWKIYPSLKKNGLKALFNPQPFSVEKKAESQETEESL